MNTPRFVRRALAGTAVSTIVLGACLAQAQILRPPEAEVIAVQSADGSAADGSVRIGVAVRLPEGLHVNANQPRDPSLIPIVLTIAPPDGVEVQELVYPTPTDLAQIGADELLSVYENEFVIGVQLRVDPALTPSDELTISGSLRYQACDDRMCYIPGTVLTEWRIPGNAGADMLATVPWGTGIAPPETSPLAPNLAAIVADGQDPVVLLDGFVMQGSTGGYLAADDFLTFIADAEAGIQQQGLLDGRGLFAMVFLVLIGGLALNLTPCVLPMIPINLAVIGAGARAGSRRRGLLLGGTYGAAMAVVYGVLGLIVILTAGTFGTINASPWFNVGIALLFIVLGLAMFDVFTIDFTKYSSGLTLGQTGRGSYALAFGMGAVAALLAGACVAPVVIQVIVFSSDMYAAGTTLALALPFLLGLGMAIPWPIAGAGISALPKPGAWMVHVKHAFGVVILATATYYGYLGYTLFADRWVDPAEVSASVEQMLEEGWHASLAEGLAVAQAEQKPVLIDMWATWCKNCLTMDRTTLVNSDVTGALDDYVKVKFQAENPDQSPAREVMERFGAIGLPTYVILNPRD